MTASEEQKLRFKPRARIIRTIGDQLISGPEAAVIELVKNAYDADASFVSIKFKPPLEVGKGRIIVVDDGTGMTLSDIEDKWMEPATTSKSVTRLSSIRKRKMMGSKGIGRFAAAKLGSRMALNSISARDGKKVEVLLPELDWDLFNGDAFLSDISIDYLTQDTEQPAGTTIEITRLNESWTADKLLRLYRELRRLVSPIDRNTDDKFGIYLDVSECTKETTGFDGLEALGLRPSVDKSHAAAEFEVTPFPLLSTSDYEVSGYFDLDGHFRGTIEIRRGGQPPRPIELFLPVIEDEQDIGKVSVRLSIFDREADVIRATVRKAGLGDVSVAEARKVLDSIAGIAIYRSGFRIRPYGDPENDWLTLDKRRVQNPSLRIGHNQIAGYISVEEQEVSGLVERSSREGFEQNAAYRRLYRLISELLTQAVEPQRLAFRDDAGLSRKRTTSFDEVRLISELKSLAGLLPAIPADQRESAKELIAKQSSLLTEKIGVLEERQRVLEAQSSLGQIISEVLHEGAPSATYLAKTGTRLVQRYQHLFNNSDLTVETKAEFPEKLSLMQENGEKLRKLFENLRPLSGGKRGPPTEFYGVDVAFAAIAIFESHPVKCRVHSDGNPKRLVGYPEDLNTALVNMVGNSVYWLEQAKTIDPRVDLSFHWQKEQAIIFVEDNGPGIPEEFAEHIFDVGFTLKNNGTGLGLNIAREALARSNASLVYHAEFEHGARFEIRFPTTRI